MQKFYKPIYNHSVYLLFQAGKGDLIEIGKEKTKLM